MSAVIVLTPVIITAWPMIASAVVSAAAAAGFALQKEEQRQKQDQGEKKDPKESLELDVDNVDIIQESMSRDEEITVVRDGVTVTFSLDARGHFKTCVDGNVSKEELERIGQDLAGRVVQQYVYGRISSEMEAQGFATVEEDRGPDDSIRLRVRRFED